MPRTPEQGRDQGCGPGSSTGPALPESRPPQPTNRGAMSRAGNDQHPRPTPRGLASFESSDTFSWQFTRLSTERCPEQLGGGALIFFLNSDLI